jgi:hypothetical protein
MDKTIEYIQSSLRSALSISKKGGHVTMTYRDQKFSFRFDNKRIIIDNLDPTVLKTAANLSSLDISTLNRVVEPELKRIDDNIVTAIIKNDQDQDQDQDQDFIKEVLKLEGFYWIVDPFLVYWKPKILLLLL